MVGLWLVWSKLWLFGCLGCFFETLEGENWVWQHRDASGGARRLQLIIWMGFKKPKDHNIPGPSLDSKHLDNCD